MRYIRQGGVSHGFFGKAPAHPPACQRFCGQRADHRYSRWSRGIRRIPWGDIGENGEGRFLRYQNPKGTWRSGCKQSYLCHYAWGNLPCQPGGKSLCKLSELSGRGPDSSFRHTFTAWKIPAPDSDGRNNHGLRSHWTRRRIRCGRNDLDRR